MQAIKVKAKDLKPGMIYLKGGYNEAGEWDENIELRSVEFVDVFSPNRGEYLVQLRNDKTGTSYKIIARGSDTFRVQEAAR